MSERINTRTPEHVVVCVDGPNADNQAAAWGANTAFDNEYIKLAGVIVSGTAVNYAPNAPLGSRDDAVSERVQLMHTARMAGLFKRGGSDVPVFVGKNVRDTYITTPIPHNAHVNHDDYDLYGDNMGMGRKAIAGDFDDALSHLGSLDGPLHVVVGGPFTEVPYFLQRPDIFYKLGHLAAQAGFEISQRAIYSKLAFNHEVDEISSAYTFLNYPNNMFYVPSDITRAPAATFQSAEELIRSNVHPEIGEIFIRHRARAEERHKEEQLRREREGQPFRAYPALSIHDLQAVMALQQSLGYERDIFEFEQIDTERAIANMVETSKMPEVIRQMGSAGVRQVADGVIPGRYVVAAQDTARYKQQALQLLR